MNVESLRQYATHTVELRIPTIKINDDIYFPRADFVVDFFTKDDFIKTSPVDKNTAAQRIKDFYKKKIDGMQAEFEKMIDSLLE